MEASGHHYGIEEKGGSVCGPMLYADCKCFAPDPEMQLRRMDESEGKTKETPSPKRLQKSSGGLFLFLNSDLIEVNDNVL